MSKLEELIKEFCPNGVEYISVEELLKEKTIASITPSLKIKRNDYKDFGEIAIISQEEEYISGYCNILDKKIVDGQYVCFGDHTENVKYVDFRFVQGADGLKIICCNNKEKIDIKYFYYAVCNFYKRHNNYERHYKYFVELQIPLPALPVQREIVRILDSFTLYSAELTAELTARRKQYEFYRDKLLTFEQPEVKQIPLGKLAKFTYGYTDVAKDVGDARFIRITDINEDGCLSSGNCKYITLNDESKKYLLKEGDLLLARTGATYGKTLYFPNNEPAVYASFLIKIDLDNSVILNRYYWHFSKSNLYWKQADKYVSKAGQQQFNTNAVSRVIVPVPSIEVQERIVKVLDNFDEICSNLKIGLPAEMEKRQQQYEYYRDKLLEFNVNINKDINITGGSR